jgi:hypothetical protein
VSDKIYNATSTGAEFWWYLDAFSQAALGKRNSVSSAVEVSRGPNQNDPSDDLIYVSGRGGIWKSNNGGQKWFAAVYNMQVSTNRDVAVNPNNPSQVVLGNTDYTLMQSNKRFEQDSISRDRPSGSGSRGYDIEFDATADEIIIATGNRDTNTEGEVFKKTAKSIGNPKDNGWTNLNLQPETGGNIPQAVTYGYHDGTAKTSQTILVAVKGKGVFRYFNGKWTASSGVSIGASYRSKFVWPDNESSGVVYLIDLVAGLNRSSDGGKTWTKIWQGMSFNNKDFFITGFITASDPNTIYISFQGDNSSYTGSKLKVYRLDNAKTANFSDPAKDSNIVDISSIVGGGEITHPGPLIIDHTGMLWVTQQAYGANNIEAGLFVMKNPKTDKAFTEITNNEYRQLVVEPVGIDVSTDGYIYLAQRGLGIAKLKINSSDDDSVNGESVVIEAESTTDSLNAQIKLYQTASKGKYVEF